MPDGRPRLLLLAILLAALVVRLAAIIVTGPGRLRFGDAQDYVDFATALCSEGRYPDRGSMPFFRAPGLPFFLAAVTLCHPASVVAGKVALALCDVATTGLVALLVLQLFGIGATRAALLAALLAAIDPFLTVAASDVTTEPLATVLLTAALCALLAARRSEHALVLAGLGGAALGLATLTRPSSLAVAPAWLLLPLLARSSGIDAGTGSRDLPDARHTTARITTPTTHPQPTTHAVRATNAPELRAPSAVVLATLAGCALVLAPWTLRNWLHFGEVIVVNDAGGYNAWRGTHPMLHEVLARADGPAHFAELSQALEQDLQRVAADQGLGEGASPRERNARWWDAALARFDEAPWRGTRILVRNALTFFRPWLDPAAYGARAVAASAAWFVPLGVLALLGLIQLWQRDPRVAALLVAGVVLAGIAHVPFQTVIRFRLPFTEPLLLALAGAAVAGLIWPDGRAPARDRKRAARRSGDLSS